MKLDVKCPVGAEVDGEPAALALGVGEPTAYQGAGVEPRGAVVGTGHRGMEVSQDGQRKSTVKPVGGNDALTTALVATMVVEQALSSGDDSMCDQDIDALAHGAGVNARLHVGRRRGQRLLVDQVEVDPRSVGGVLQGPDLVETVDDDLSVLTWLVGGTCCAGSDNVALRLCCHNSGCRDTGSGGPVVVSRDVEAGDTRFDPEAVTVESHRDVGRGWVRLVGQVAAVDHGDRVVGGGGEFRDLPHYRAVGGVPVSGDDVGSIGKGASEALRSVSEVCTAEGSEGNHQVILSSWEVNRGSRRYKPPAGIGTVVGVLRACRRWERWIGPEHCPAIGRPYP